MLLKDYISDIDQLFIEAQEIYDYLNITMSEEIEEVVSRGNDLSVYIARTGKMMADAKYYLNKATQDSILHELGKDGGLSPSTLNKLVETSVQKETMLFTWVERLNRTATHQMDWCRTLVSKAKEERKYSGGIQG